MRRKKENKKEARFILLFLFVIVMFTSFLSAGVGIKWDQESKLVNEGERTCLTYNIYNPWPEDSSAEIKLSEELEEVLVFQESEKKFIPANTPSSEAIPLEFCFEAPFVYEKDCLIGNTFLCEQTCNEEQKIYDGNVLVSETVGLEESGGAGGSAVSASVSAPLRIKIICNAYSRNYTPVYVLIVLIAAIILLLVWQKIKRGRSKKVKKKRR